MWKRSPASPTLTPPPVDLTQSLGNLLPKNTCEAYANTVTQGTQAYAFYPLFTSSPGTDDGKPTFKGKVTRLFGLASILSLMDPLPASLLSGRSTPRVPATWPWGHLWSWEGGTCWQAPSAVITSPDLGIFSSGFAC